MFIDPFERGAGENRSSPREKLLTEYYESQFAIYPARGMTSITAKENTYMDLHEAKRACKGIGRLKKVQENIKLFKDGKCEYALPFKKPRKICPHKVKLGDEA